MREQCSYCHNYGHTRATIAHNPNCPVVKPGVKGLYDQGYNDGREGKLATSNNPAYTLGWVRGECALEEAENGEKTWGY